MGDGRPSCVLCFHGVRRVEHIIPAVEGIVFPSQAGPPFRICARNIEMNLELCRWNVVVASYLGLYAQVIFRVVIMRT